MVSDKYLNKYYKIQKAELEKNFFLITQVYKAEVVHKLRVNLKKIRALFYLLEHIDPQLFKVKKQYRKLRSLFKVVGQIRDVQVQKELIDLFEKELEIHFTDYCNYLNKIEDNHIKQFRKWILTNKLEHSEKPLHKINKIYKKINHKTLKIIARQFITLRIEKISELHEFAHDEEKLHKIRALLKEIMYIHNILKNHYPDFVFLKGFSELIEKSEKALGDWHDRHVAVEYVDLFHKKIGIPVEQEDSYGKLIQAIDAERIEKFGQGYQFVVQILELIETNKESL
jgi:CHAD domain-containing protein